MLLFYLDVRRERLRLIVYLLRIFEQIAVRGSSYAFHIQDVES
jgi:hypothetical protein